MGLLDRLSQSTLGVGIKPPTSYSKRAQGRNLTPAADLAAAASTGYAFRDPTLGTTRYTDNIVGNTDVGALGPSVNSYQKTTFQDQLKGTNKLVDYKAKTYAFRPGNFKTDIATYTERIFLQQQQAAGQAPTNPSNLITATAQSAPVLTPTTLVGTAAGMPFDDGRYNITIGFGFIQYGVGEYE